jgi:hypothetical protein
MRSVAGVALVYLLGVLLVSTSPIGTGQGVHRDQLVDLLVPHTHYLASGSDVHGRPLAVAGEPQGGQTVGAGAGAAAADGLALTPPLPEWARLAHQPAVGMRSPSLDEPPPVGRSDPPPDPPPTAVSRSRH